MHFILTFKKYTQESKLVNRKIFVGAAAGVLVVILVVFTLTGTSVVSDVEGGFFAPSTQEVLPLGIELFDFSISERNLLIEKWNNSFSNWRHNTFS